MKLSIIVPVYGVEKYIEECIYSLLIPNYNDYEIVVVNDGTKDRSIDIIREKFDDHRIRIVEQDNGGLSSARNLGIREAKGEYVWFFDSDDWADTSKLPFIFSMLDGVDLVYQTSYYRNFETSGKQTITKIENNSKTGIELASGEYFHPAQFYIYRLNVLLESSHFFKEGILHEDSLFTPIAITLCNKVKCYNEPIYHYRQRQGSITKTISAKRIDDMLYVVKSLAEYGDLYIPLNTRYKWGRCVVSTTNGLLFLSQKNRDQQCGNRVVKQIDRNWSVIRYFRKTDTINNIILGWLATLSFGKLTYMYRLLFKIRY